MFGMIEAFAGLVLINYCKKVDAEYMKKIDFVEQGLRDENGDILQNKGAFPEYARLVYEKGLIDNFCMDCVNELQSEMNKNVTDMEELEKMFKDKDSED